MVKKTSLAILLVLYALAPISPAAAKEMRLAIFPFSVNAKDDISYIRDGISSLLPSRIAVTGKLAIIDSYTVRSELNKLPAEHPLSADIALGKKLQADYILVGSITKIGTNASLDTRLTAVVLLDDRRQELLKMRVRYLFFSAVKPCSPPYMIISII